MDRSEKLKFIEDHYATFWYGDLDDLERELAPQFIDQAAAPGSPTGREGVRQHALAMRAMCNDMKVTIDEAVVEGTVVVVRGTWRGTHTGEAFGHPPTGRPFEFGGIVIWEFGDDGRLVRRAAQIDTMAILRAVSDAA